MKKLYVVLGLTLTAALLAGCGGSSDSSSTTASSGGGDGGGDELSKSDWISQADAICTNYEDETDDLQDEYEALDFSPSSSPAELGEIADLLRQVEAKAEDETEELRQLEPPSEDAALVDSMITKVETTNGIGLRAADALEHKDERKLQTTIAEGNKIKGEAEKLAEGYGLEVCGS